jgi:hypothetical protein
MINRAQTFIIYYIIKVNEIKENIDLSFEIKEVEAYTWIHKKELNEILFKGKDCSFEGYSLSKKNQFEKKQMSSLNLNSYNQGEGEGVPYGHLIAFKYLIEKSGYKSNF